jgi:dTDP-4-amino-4,6-dideoxygalactose transaminase
MGTKLAIHGGTPVRSKSWPSWPVWDQREVQALTAALEEAKWAIDSPIVARFENDFASAHDAAFGIAVTSGTTGLMIALRAAGVAAGDEVVVPDYTFMASATAVLALGAIPIFADVESETLNLDPNSVEAVLSPKTRAIMPVHFGGMPADMDRIGELAAKHNLKVIEDAAQAVGASWRGTHVGAIGDAGAFSFQSSKNVTAGEGGMVLTNDPELAERAESYRNCGRMRSGVWYRHYLMGMNYRMTGFQAAILEVQMERLEEQFAKREGNARYLSEKLAAIPGIFPLEVPEGVTGHAYHLYIFRYNRAEFAGVPRKNFVEALQREGIPAAGGYLCPVHQLDFLQEHAELQVALGKNYDPKRMDYSRTDCPAAKKAVEEEAVWLGQSVLLAERSDMDDIAEAIDKAHNLSSDLVNEEEPVAQ